MSLINEALKRTEADKRNRTRSGNPRQGMTPSYEDPPRGRARRSLGQDVRSVLLRVGGLAVAVSCVLLAIEPGAVLLLSRISPAGAAETHGGTTGDAEVDEAIRLHKPLEAFLAQGKEEATSLAEGYRRLAGIVAAAETER